MKKRHPASATGPVRRAAIVLCACVLALCLLWAAATQIAVWRHELGVERLRRLYRGWRTPLPFAAMAEGDADVSAASGPVQEDFRELYKINPHIVGWLNAGPDIDLPVVQYDNEYYLNHNFYGRRDANGTLFVNEANALWPPDDAILIHGHNMKSGAQFGRLRRFGQFSWAARHPIVRFRTIRDAEDVCYAVVAAFNASMNEGDPAYFNLGRIRFADEASCAAFLYEILQISLWRPPLDLRPGDRLLMLVTCSYLQDNGRFVLVCRRLREGETCESIEALFAGLPAD